MLKPMTIDQPFPDERPTDDERQREQMRAIVGQLEAEARKRVGDRKPIEERWIEDLEQYHGRYPETTAQKIANNGTSGLFINQTRPKTDAMSAKLMDLLFPTDDRNWGVKPTPVPELTREAAKAAAAAHALAEKAKAAAEAAGTQEGQEPDPEVEELKAQARDAAEYENRMRAVMNAAQERAELMQNEIDDQLKQSQYHAVARDQIEDACKLGTGVLKGPVTGDKLRKGWKENGDGTYSLQWSEGDQPSMRYVNIWGFFPDMTAAKAEDGSIYERHLMTERQLRGLAKLQGFDKKAIAKLIMTKGYMPAPDYISRLRSIKGDNQLVSNELFHVWEYTGSLDVEQMRMLAAAMDPESLQEFDEVDPLADLKAIVWFCNGEVLKFAIYPYDSGECIYSVYNLVKDEHSPFGFGIPALMRDPQSAINGAWRAMMDNAALGSGPQIVMDDSKVEPEDGKWTITPRKVWKLKAPWDSPTPPFWTFEFNMRQQELSNIIMLAEKFIDDVTGMPKIAQGEQGNGVTKTAGGMTLLMNSANVVFRRMVKNYDDDVTVPSIRRFYDWNMQHSQKVEIKGDFEIDARGSSVLLVREMQSQNLMMIALQFGPHPVFGPMLKNRQVLRKLFQAQMIPADDVMLSDDEIDAIVMQAQGSAEAEAQAAQQAMMEREMALREQELDIKEQEINSRVEIENMKKEMQIQLHEIRKEIEMQKLAAHGNYKLDDAETRERIEDKRISAKERSQAVEIAMTNRLGPTGGGQF
jgi:hypothetical protein